MQTMVPLYGFGGGGGGTGATLTVTAPAGATVTVSKDGKSKTKVADSSGAAVFKGLATGEWTVTITDGEQTAQKTVTVTAEYSTSITFFAATIHVTYPAGSTCNATDGVTTITAPDTGGTWACVVPNAGTWTISASNGVDTESVIITDNGQTKTVRLRQYFVRESNVLKTLKLYNASANNNVVTSNGNVFACTWVKSVDLTHFNTIKAFFSTMRSYPLSGKFPCIVIRSASDSSWVVDHTSINAISYKQFATSTDVQTNVADELDVSDFSGVYDIGLTFSGSSSYNGTLTIDTFCAEV